MFVLKVRLDWSYVIAKVQTNAIGLPIEHPWDCEKKSIFILQHNITRFRIHNAKVFKNEMIVNIVYVWHFCQKWDGNPN